MATGSGAPLTWLVNQAEYFKNSKEKVKKAREVLHSRMNSDLEETRSDCASLKQLVNDLENTATTYVEKLYRSRCKEFDAAEKELTTKIQRIEQLQGVDLTETTIPETDVTVDIDLKPIIKSLMPLTKLGLQCGAQSSCNEASSEFVTGKRSSEFSSPATKKPRLSRSEENSADAAQVSTPTDIAIKTEPDESGTQQRQESVDYTRDRAYVRQYINCSACKKPRCIYSAKKLTTEQMEQLNLLMKDWQYKCGDGTPPNSTLEIDVEKNITCEEDVSYHYFFRNVFPSACYKCGSTRLLLPIPESMKEQYSTIHPVCRGCNAKGHTERVRKKYTRKEKADQPFCTDDDQH